ncbi:MAG: hypothetical protein MUE50_00105 [Pirellulaceae bacterium]|jgi:hypothetical protein|nr:hypothetical protein [Pirellulaceae bacterium]
MAANPLPPPNVAWGATPETQTNRAKCRAFADQFAVLPRSAWKTVRRRQFVKHIYDQLDGMCTSNGASGLVMWLRAMSGQPHKVLVPPTLYEQHSRWGTGSSLGENIDALINIGVCDADFCGGDQVRLGAVTSKPWRENAARYKLLPDEVWNCNGQLANVVSALQYGFACLIGLNWPGGGGHSVLATDVEVDGGKLWLFGPNSWGNTWNGNGFWQLSESQLSSMSRYGAYAARAVVEG